MRASRKKVTGTFCLKGPSGAFAQKVPVTVFLAYFFLLFFFFVFFFVSVPFFFSVLVAFASP